MKISLNLYEQYLHIFRCVVKRKSALTILNCLVALCFLRAYMEVRTLLDF